MGEPSSVRSEVCPKCKQRFYDVRNGICYACGYSMRESYSVRMILEITLGFIILFLIFTLILLLK